MENLTIERVIKSPDRRAAIQEFHEQHQGCGFAYTILREVDTVTGAVRVPARYFGRAMYDALKMGDGPVMIEVFGPDEAPWLEAETVLFE